MNVVFKHLSELLSENVSDNEDPVCELVEKLGDRFKKVIEIELEETSTGGYLFKQVRFDSFDAQDFCKYLYRAGPPNGMGVTLTCKLGKPNKKDKKLKTPKDFAATALQKKVRDYLREMSKIAQSEADREFGKMLFESLKADEDKILEDITSLAEQITLTEEDAIVTLVLSNNENHKYPRDILPLKDFFYQCANPETKEQKGNSSIGENAVCSCCNKLNEKVFCQPQTIPYFTFDKPGFIAGGFFQTSEIQKKAWRNFPLCAKCFFSIRKGFKSVQEKLKFKLSGITYLLIPNFTNWTSQNAKAIVDSFTSLSKSTDTAAQRDQEEIFAHRLSREENTASFNFLFYRQKPMQSRVEILCTLENVLPSRMSKIAEAIDKAESHNLLANFGEWSKIPKISSIKVDFRLLNDIYQPRLKIKGDAPIARFLSAVQRVVYGQRFDAKEFFDSAVRYIRDELREQLSESGDPPRLNFPIHRCLAAAFWLLQLKLLKLDESNENELSFTGETMTDYPKLNEENLNERFDEFFKTFNGLFAREEQRACYLMGILCEQVLREQRKRFDNRQPFFRKLKDLNMDEAEICGLLQKIKWKLTEYDKDHFYWELEKAIAERFRRAGSNWKITNSEINFFFTLGLCEAPLFRNKPANTENINNEEQN